MAQRSANARPAACLVFAVTVAAACGCSSSGQQGAPTPRAFGYIGNVAPVTDWDPASAHRAFALSQMYETLTRYNVANQRVTPALANSWEPSKDGMSWRFQLRDGVRFHTGRVMDATAVRAAIERDAKFAPRLWAPVRGISTPGQETLQFSLKYPARLDLITAAAHGAFVYDTRAAGRNAPPKPGKDGGTGPYRLARWRPHSPRPLRLERFPGYWNGWRGSRYTSVNFRVQHDPTTAARLLRTGHASFAADLDVHTWNSLRGIEGVTTAQTPSWDEWLALLDTKRISDRRVRTALSHLIDRGAVSKASTNSGATTSPSDALIPSGLYGNSPDLPIPGHDAEKARALLAKAGYGTGHRALRLRLSYPAHDPAMPPIARAVSISLRKLHIAVSTHAVSGRIRPGAQDITLLHRLPDYPDPYPWFATLFRGHGPGNVERYDNRHLDRLIDSVRRLEVSDPNAAAQRYRRMQRILLRDCPMVLLGVTRYRRAFSSTFTGYADNPAYPAAVNVYDLSAQ